MQDVNFSSGRLFLVWPIQSSLRLLSGHLRSHLPGSPDIALKATETAGDLAGSIWSETALPPTEELHPALRQALGFNENGSAHVFWKLKPALIEGLNKRVPAAEVEGAKLDAPPGYGLAIKLSQLASERLGETKTPRIVPIRISSASFYLSQTRLGQLVIEIAVDGGETSAPVLVEVAHALAHTQAYARRDGDQISRLSSHQQLLDSTDSASQFRLRDLVLGLACPTNDGSCMIQVPRAFTFAMATTFKHLAEQDQRELAARMARRLTADYTPGEALDGVHFATPFANITHACSFDGGAILVSNAGQTKFLEDFVRNQGEQIYLKLALLAHKELHDLVALSQGSAITIEHSDRDDEAQLTRKLARIVEMRERMLNFRLAHRFSLAGFAANQNLVHSAWRKAMHSDALLADIDADIGQANEYLRSARDAIRDRKAEVNRQALARQNGILAGGFAFLATLEGLKVCFDLVAGGLNLPSNESKAADAIIRALGKIPEGSLPPAWVEPASAVAPFLIAAIVGAISYRLAVKAAKSP